MNYTQTFRDVLLEYAAEAGIALKLFRPLDDAEAAAVTAAVEERFGDAANGAMAGWWHSKQKCQLPTTARMFQDGRGWAHLTVVAPDPTEPVWLIAENWGGGRPAMYVFASTPTVVQEVLGSSHGFEYIVASQRLDWLFAEDHEECVSVAGAEVVQRLNALTAESGPPQTLRGKSPS